MTDAPRGERAATAQRLAAHYSVSRATVYRITDLGGARRPRRPARLEYRGWVRVAIPWSHRAPKPVPMDLAIAAVIKAGDLPPEAARMPLSTVHRLRAQLDLTPRPKRSQPPTSSI